MRNLIFLWCALLPVFGAFGQDIDGEINEDKRQEIESMKVAYITRKVQFTTEESQKFWAVYNEWYAEREAQRQAGKELRKRMRSLDGEISEAELDEMMSEKFDIERNLIDIEERYFQAFKKVISAEKLANFYQAEREFKRVLLNKLREGRNGDRDRKRRNW